MVDLYREPNGDIHCLECGATGLWYTNGMEGRYFKQSKESKDVFNCVH